MTYANNFYGKGCFTDGVLTAVPNYEYVLQYYNLKLSLFIGTRNVDDL